MTRGRIHKRGKTWTVVYDEPSPDGKRRQRTKGGFATQRMAQAFLTDQLSRIDGGRYAAPAKLTVAEYLNAEWLPAVESTLRPLSVTKYRAMIRRYIIPALGGVRLQALSAGHLNGLYAQLERDGLSIQPAGSFMPSSDAACGTLSGGDGFLATWPGWPIPRRVAALVRRPGRHRSFAGSSIT